MGRPSRRARQIRKANEFDLSQLLGRLIPPTQAVGGFSWGQDDIRNARSAQLKGKFKQPSRLAKAMRTDDSLFNAYQNRLAPQRCIGVQLVPANTSARALSVASEAEGLFGAKGIGVRTETLSDIVGDIANHGVAFGVLTHTAREDGSRVDLAMDTWPIEWVEWIESDRQFVTNVQGGASRIPIVHGDGRWVVFQKHDLEPFAQEACVLPASFVWWRHASGLRDWSQGSNSHGNPKVVGEMPAGVPLQNDEGALTSEATAFLMLLQALYLGDAPVGIRPAGSETELLTNTSTAWQVWDTLSNREDKAAARIYTGTDGLLGAQGGAPGVDISELFGVAATIVQGDLNVIERAVLTGIIEIWAAINFGDSSLAPSREYLLPDRDSDGARESLAKRQAAFHQEIEKRRANGFVVDTATVNKLAKDFNVPAPVLPEKKTQAPSITLAPTDIARVVTVNEARASAGLNALALADGTADPDGLLTVEQFSAKKAAAVAPPPPTPAPPRANGAGTQPPPS